MMCSRCHRPLKSPEAIAAGMGEICKRKSAGLAGGGGQRMQIHFLSVRREDGSRRWLAIDDKQYTVAVYDAGQLNGVPLRWAKCQCGSESTPVSSTHSCQHIQEVLEKDADRFGRKL